MFSLCVVAIVITTPPSIASMLQKPCAKVAVVFATQLQRMLNNATVGAATLIVDQDTAHQFEVERLRRVIESTTDTTALKEMCRKLLQLSEGQRTMLNQLLQGMPRLGG